MKGLLLAGGNGTRMWPTTRVVSKHLLPCYDKPTIYYPLSTLIELGCDDICVVCRHRDMLPINDLLASLLTCLRIKFSFAQQDRPLGLAHAITEASDWIIGQPFWMILGDNIFTDAPVNPKLETGCAGFTYECEDPSAFGVVETEPDSIQILRIEEKPEVPFSTKALTGLYWFDYSAVSRALLLKASARGELEITDLIRSYLPGRPAHAIPLDGHWFDNGTPESMALASEWMRKAWKRHGEVIGSPELSAFKTGRISKEQFESLLSQMPDCQYRSSLLHTLK